MKISVIKPLPCSLVELSMYLKRCVANKQIPLIVDIYVHCFPFHNASGKIKRLQITASDLLSILRKKSVSSSYANLMHVKIVLVFGFAEPNVDGVKSGKQLCIFFFVHLLVLN